MPIPALGRNIGKIQFHIFLLKPTHVPSALQVLNFSQLACLGGCLTSLVIDCLVIDRHRDRLTIVYIMDGTGVPGLAWPDLGGSCWSSVKA